MSRRALAFHARARFSLALSGSLSLRSPCRPPLHRDAAADMRSRAHTGQSRGHERRQHIDLTQNPRPPPSQPLACRLLPGRPDLLESYAPGSNQWNRGNMGTMIHACIVSAPLDLQPRDAPPMSCLAHRPFSPGHAAQIRSWQPHIYCGGAGGAYLARGSTPRPAAGAKRRALKGRAAVRVAICV